MNNLLFILNSIHEDIRLKEPPVKNLFIYSNEVQYKCLDLNLTKSSSDIAIVSKSWLLQHKGLVITSYVDFVSVVESDHTYKKMRGFANIDCLDILIEKEACNEASAIIELIQAIDLENIPDFKRMTINK